MRNLPHTVSWKHCLGCEQDQPRYLFSRSKFSKDGLQALCRLCKAVAREEDQADEQTRADMGPMRWPYDATCLLCSRSVAYLLTDAQYAAARPLQCAPCGGRALLTRSDMGSLSSPSAAAVIQFKSRTGIVPRRSVSPVG